MLKKILISLSLVFILLIVIGTIFVPDKAPESQAIYTQQLNGYRDLMKEVKEGANGNQIKKVKDAITTFIDEPRYADLWYAEVKSVSEHEDILYIVTQYKENQHDSYIDYSQMFTLMIHDSETKKKVANLQKGHDIFFSGSLGKEQSITFKGRLEQPEYIFSPTKLKLSLDGEDINIPQFSPLE
jgi:hypothetical protein